MQKTTLTAKGLYSYPNQISQVPNGALIQADNVVIDREGVLEPRRGYNQLPGVLGSLSANRSDQIFRFGDNVLSHYGPLQSPNKISFYAPTVTLTGIQTSGSAIITDMTSVSGIYAGQYITVSTVEQNFIGDITIGSNLITNISSTQGLYAGQGVGGIGIPVNTTISSISGTGPYTVTMSANSTYTKSIGAYVASNSNILGFIANTTVLTVGTTSVTLSNNSSVTARSLTFNPSDVNISLDTINITNHGFVDGQSIEFTSTGTLPAGLTANVEYFVINSTDSSFQVALVAGSQIIDLTTQGAGVHTVKQRPSVAFYGWIDYSGNYYRPDSLTKLRSVEANNNVYFTTSTGVQKLDSLTNSIVLAGAPKGLDGYALLDNSVSGFMLDNTQVAYRVFWAYNDANKNLIIGAPSQRITVSNSTGTTKNVVLNITVPQNIGTNYFYQVYRSGFSASASDEPNDELALVYEAPLTSIDIINEFVTFTDQTPESLRTGATAYTSPSQEGILQANTPPPFAHDVTLFKGSTFYTNTQTKQSLILTLLAVSSQFSIFGDITSVGANTPTTVRNTDYSITGNLILGSNVITNVNDTTSLAVGQDISDATNPTYLPAGTVITNIISSTSISVSNVATASSVGDAFNVIVSAIFIGQQVSGTGIPANTVITNVYLPVTLIGDVTAASPTIINLSSTSGLEIGQPVSDGGVNIPANTTILAIPTNTSITMSKNATGTLVGDSIDFGAGFQISNAATSTLTQTTLTLKNGNGGVQLNDTITIDGTTFTAKLVENISAKQFKIYSQGTPAQNISDTAQSLVRVVNRTTGPVPLIYAYYLSGFQSLPGQMQFEERIFGGGQFYATAGNTSQGAVYSPNLPGPGGVSAPSKNDQFGNGLYYSKTNQPEAVPILNFIRVGSAHANILRVIALRDSLFVLKEDGIFRLTGEGPSSFRVNLFDSTTQILAAESAVSLNNLIFMLTKYGIVTVSDTGVTVISRAIEDKMLDLFEANFNSSKNLSFGISYESDRKYIFFCITNSEDTTPTQAFVFNTFTNTWTRWVLSQTCGAVQPKDDVLYLGDVNSNTFDIERKTRTYTDYTDSSFSVNLLAETGVTSTGSFIISGISNTSYFTTGQVIYGTGIQAGSQIIDSTGSTLTLNKTATSSGTTVLIQDYGKTVILDSLSNVEVGDVLYQASGRFSIITVVNSLSGTVTTRDYIDNWVLGVSTILKAAQNTVKYVPQTAGNPGALKQFRECVLLFQIPFFNIVDIGFDTDLASGTESVPLNGSYGFQWGRFKWGTIPWGGGTKPLQSRTYVPQQKQRCSLLNVTVSHREAYSFYRLNGISYVHNNLSERVGV